MKKIIIFIFLLLISSCVSIKMSNSIRSTYNEYQLDSICRVERLPDDLSKWHGNYIYDYETNRKISQYIFIKDITRKNEAIYTITVDDTTYYFTKRVVEQIQK